MVATDDRQSLIHPFPMIAACAAGSPERLDPFGIYRSQATFIYGRCDGKIGAPEKEIVCFQLVTRVGDD